MDINYIDVFLVICSLRFLKGLQKVAFFVSLPFFQGARSRGSPSLLAQRPRRWAYPDDARGAECRGQLGHWRGTSRRSADQQQSPWLLSGVTWDKGNREKHFQEHTIHRKTLRFRCFFVFSGVAKKHPMSGFLKNPLEAKDTEWDHQRSVSLAHWSKSIFIRGKPWSFVHAGLLYGQR